MVYDRALCCNLIHVAETEYSFISHTFIIRIRAISVILLGLKSEKSENLD